MANCCCPDLNASPQPVFGSLYGNPNQFLTPVLNTPIEFNTAGPTFGMTADPITNSITINQFGLYEIHYSLTDKVSNSVGTFLRYVIAINGVSDFQSSTFFSNSNIGEAWFNGSNTILRTLNPNDIITIRPTGIVGNNQYINPILIVKKIQGL
ncbi:hypothetical protein Q8G31_30305 [Priestia megaterium]|uniref:hypothetical protein n=1 Tax=Priestia megaterium TaxID=1404 RepID=UPI002731F227|nr:hypothetical protein [Priestia megaterium]MDP1383940.1 hypothetical protein [Priestia megaterium]MDP1428092.1 hypothetical protein [Priestia megaterium]